MSRFKVLVTKTGTAIPGRLKENNIEIIEADLIRTNPVITLATIESLENIKDRPVVFTSANAVNAVKEYIRDEPLQFFCLSGKTKTTILENFTKAEILDTADNATELAGKIIERGVPGVVFLCGDIRRDELPALLSQHNVTVKEIIVYETLETPVVINELCNAVVFFSPSGVRSFFSCNKPAGAITYFSIGETTADEIKKYTNNKIIVAGTPSQEALAAAVINHFKQTVHS
jgi:uroporphyrinogen-III synthase